MAENQRIIQSAQPQKEAEDISLLAEQFRRGNDSAFEVVVLRYSNEIASLANRLLGWPGDVEDVVQDIFLAAFLGRKKFRQQAGLKTWLYAITVNKCRTYQRKQIMKFRFLKQLSNPSSEEDSYAGEELAMRKEVFLEVRKSIIKLPEKYRVVIVLRYLQQLSINKISQIIGVTENTVQVRLNRARKYLKKQMTYLVEDQL